MNGKPELLASPAELVDQVFGQWGPDERTQFLRLFLQKRFNDQAGSEIVFAEGSDETAVFAIRAAGPPITKIEISDRILSDEARAAVLKYTQMRNGTKPPLDNH